jgi:hypothetical protein
VPYLLPLVIPCSYLQSLYMSSTSSGMSMYLQHRYVVLNRIQALMSH